MKARTQLRAGDVYYHNGQTYYKVERGDYLVKIAQKIYGPSVDPRAAALFIYDNNKQVIGSNPNVIHVGQKLYIPDYPNILLQ